jgi:hypothetical protein
MAKNPRFVGLGVHAETIGHAGRVGGPPRNVVPRTMRSETKPGRPVSKKWHPYQ